MKKKNDKRNLKGSEIIKLISQFELKQTTNLPNHILSNSFSCIDLLFTSQPNLVMESGVHLWLHQSCHYKIIYVNFKLRVYYPIPYEHGVWHYKKANVDLIQRAMYEFNWGRTFDNKNINEKASILNNTINNVLSNLVMIGIHHSMIMRFKT